MPIVTKVTKKPHCPYCMSKQVKSINHIRKDHWKCSAVDTNQCGLMFWWKEGVEQ